MGPEYVEGHNPLTGLPLSDEGALRHNPLIVSITNFPPSARPQAGLVQAAQIWETSIGQGMTRFLAVLYGDYLSELRVADAQSVAVDPYEFVIGPVRSGRIAFEEIKTVYPNSQLIIRNASKEVIPRLTNVVVLDSLDPEDVNSAGLRIEELEDLLATTADPRDYEGLMFSVEPPPGGIDGSSLRLVYNIFNDVAWEYDADRGVYLRFQNQAEPGGELFPARDRLSAQQITAENVVVLFAQHRFENLAGTILEIKLAFILKANGFLLRDGRLYDIHWGTTDRMLRIEDSEGNPFQLKPGRTYFEVVSFQSTWNEDERLLRFHSPPLPTLTRTPTPTPTPSPTASPTSTPTPTPP